MEHKGGQDIEGAVHGDVNESTLRMAFKGKADIRLTATSGTVKVRAPSNSGAWVNAGSEEGSVFLRSGIQVYEAWWTELAPDHPILPPGPIEIMKSQYEREKAGVLDFSKLPRVFYITDSYYHSQEAVRDRQKNAQLVASFPKPMGDKSVDVYRLN